MTDPQRLRFAHRLRALREQTGLSGNGFARKIGWQQSKVSRVETGKQLLTEADISTWVAATGHGRIMESELIGLLAAAKFEYATVKDMLSRGGMAAQQAYVGTLEVDATRIAEYQSSMIPGIVQTSAYAHELLVLPGGPKASDVPSNEIEQLVDARIRRQQVLYEPGKQIQVVIGEAALHDPPGAKNTLVGQLDRLIAVAGLSQVELGIIPFGTPMPIMPICSFAVHDFELVLIETLTGEQRLNDPAEIAVYVEAFDRLLGAAVIGDEAVELIQRVSAELRGRD